MLSVSCLQVDKTIFEASEILLTCSHYSLAFQLLSKGNVFSTDAIVATLMTATRSVYSWDVVVQVLYCASSTVIHTFGHGNLYGLIKELIPFSCSLYNFLGLIFFIKRYLYSCICRSNNNYFLDLIQMPLHSCAEPNIVK